MAISRNAYPCREMEVAERMTGKKESGRLSEIPKTIKLAIIEATKVKNARSSIILDSNLKSYKARISGK